MFLKLFLIVMYLNEDFSGLHIFLKISAHPVLNYPVWEPKSIEFFDYIIFMASIHFIPYFGEISYLFINSDTSKDTEINSCRFNIQIISVTRDWWLLEHDSQFNKTMSV